MNALIKFFPLEYLLFDLFKAFDYIDYNEDFLGYSEKIENTFPHYITKTEIIWYGDTGSTSTGDHTEHAHNPEFLPVSPFLPSRLSST